MDCPAPGDALWLAVAFLVHAHLARRLSLTSVPPAAVLDRLTSFLDPAGLAAAQAAAAEAIAGLDQALDGPPPLAPAITQDALLDSLEAAIQAGETLCIRYWSAWRGEVTERQVQPQCIEWRGDRVYLIAHCHLRGALRTFRLDRILDVIRCEKGPDVSASPGP
jgi:predicted DNA-binding transcriptional regulator YafY